MVRQLMGHHIGQGPIANARQGLGHACCDAHRGGAGRVRGAVALVGHLHRGQPFNAVGAFEVANHGLKGPLGHRPDQIGRRTGPFPWPRSGACFQRGCRKGSGGSQQGYGKGKASGADQPTAVKPHCQSSAKGLGHQSYGAPQGCDKQCQCIAFQNTVRSMPTTGVQVGRA